MSDLVNFCCVCELIDSIPSYFYAEENRNKNDPKRDDRLTVRVHFFLIEAEIDNTRLKFNSELRELSSGCRIRITYLRPELTL